MRLLERDRRLEALAAACKAVWRRADKDVAVLVGSPVERRAGGEFCLVTLGVWRIPGDSLWLSDHCAYHGENRR